MPIEYSPTVIEIMAVRKGPEPDIPVPYLALPTPGSLPIEVDPEPELPSRHGT